MESLTVTYMILWAAVALYLGWMGSQQRTLQQRIRQLEREVQLQRGRRDEIARAA